MNDLKNISQTINLESKDDFLRIIIAGGGTGGHIFPAVAIANAIKKIRPQTKFLFVGAKGKMEMEKIPEAGFNIIGLTIAGYNRSSFLKNLSLPFKLFKSYFEVRKIVADFKPHAVIGVGGYSTFPILRYAQSQKIPTFIHEANSFAGKSNLILSKRAKIVFVASESMNQFFPYQNVIVSGNPVRNIFSDANIIRQEAVEFFSLDPQKKIVFVMGGSLGAKSINETIESNLSYFIKNDLQLIWQTGKNYAPKAASVEELNTNIWISSFISKMEYAYTAADIVVSRAGAMSVAELCVVGKPVIFVPYPLAAENHQEANAKALVDKEAAIMILDKDVQSNLISTIDFLISNPEKVIEMKKNIYKLANTSADEFIADQILSNL
ncbi:MAG: undecaprenyldiphospho-muramoylpentapeptide beta-N-acetylglucosaminyltransferase [Ginsengibacter sp.]